MSSLHSAALFKLDIFPLKKIIIRIKVPFTSCWRTTTQKPKPDQLVGNKMCNGINLKKQTKTIWCVLAKSQFLLEKRKKKGRFCCFSSFDMQNITTVCWLELS
jgi:hypothetical protein